MVWGVIKQGLDGRDRLLLATVVQALEAGVGRGIRADAEVELSGLVVLNKVLDGLEPGDGGTLVPAYNDSQLGNDL